MTKQEFRELTEKRIVFLDGGMGSCLFKEGMPQGVCPEKWMLENPQIQYKIQASYVEAGADIIYTPTFTSNRPKLTEHGLGEKVREINIELVKCARKAADLATDRKVYVCGDLTMTGVMLKPMGPLDFEELIDIYKEQVGALIEAGVDCFVVETMMSLQETRAAVIAIKELCDLPIMATMTFESDGKTLMGSDPATCAVTLASLGVDAVGTNCSTGPVDMAANVAKMAAVVDIPIIAKPNAGLPTLNENKETVYDNTPEKFAEQFKLLIEAGASVVGGCCGTNPDYIKALYEKHYQKNNEKKYVEGIHYLTSERKTVAFGLDDSFMIIGERINPTGKKAFQAELREGNIDRALEFATQQEDNGAKILDVNVGLDGVDEKELMLRVVEELSVLTSLPLCIDSSHVDIIEAVLRRYPGRALINSISNESHKRDALLAIAKKYGAMFILLPLSDKGLPKDIDEKISIINEVSDKAFELGFKKEDIVVDGLVATVGANKNAGVETLDTIKYCYANGFATTCGLSNISFGLPERGYINATFLAMAIANGLTMAIANPNQNLLMNTALAANLLKNKDEADIAYIERMNALKDAGVELGNGNVTLGASLATESKEENDCCGVLKTIVLKGKKSSVEEATNVCIKEGKEPSYILNEVLIPAINEVGALFESGRYFLPQLIASAETMKMSIEVLEPLLKKGKDSKSMPTVVIATVQGDIHDIGKNLVALMLKNYGFNVYDLGKDVPNEKVIEKALEYDADIIALSALMTTTMKEMDEVVKLAKAKNVRAQIVIGGAVTTQHYADEIHADGYSKDAADAVKLCQKLLNMV